MDARAGDIAGDDAGADRRRGRRVALSSLVPTVTALVLLSACSLGSEDPLTDLGGGLSEWIAPSTAPTTTLPDVTAGSDNEAIIPLSQVRWFNDGLDETSETPPTGTDDVLARVSARANGEDRFLQASRREMAVVLPSLRFPAAMPGEIESITSQLVMDPRSQSLGGDQVAAFGFWVDEPYSVSRSAGQAGTLEVYRTGTVPDCDTMLDGTCSETAVGGNRGILIEDEAGSRWMWAEREFRYEMFLRSSVAGAGSSMLATSIRLDQLVATDLGAGDQTATGEQPSSSPPDEDE